MSYDAKAIANFFLKLAEQSGDQISPLKMEKLIYFAHGWYLAVNDSPLIDEDVQAWEYGPVIPSIYHEFKKFGANAITECVQDYDSETDQLYKPSVEDESEVTEFLTIIWNAYKKFSAIALSSSTHQKGSPWSIAREKNHEKKRHYCISDEDIKKYYKNQLEKNEI